MKRGQHAPARAGRGVCAFVLLALCGLTFGATAAHGDPLKPWAGGATPALVLKDPAGKTYDLTAYRGKVVLVNFWATWCPPCREEMPSMQALRQELGARGFEVLAVNLSESEEKIGAFSDAELIDLPFPMDRDGAAARRWKVNMLPASFVIDRSGRIRYQLRGEANWTGADIKPIIERLLGADANGRSASAAQQTPAASTPRPRPGVPRAKAYCACRRKTARYAYACSHTALSSRPGRR